MIHVNLIEHGPAPLAHLAPEDCDTGTEALCGYRLEGLPVEGLEICPKCTTLNAEPEFPFRTVREHVHSWVQAGAAIKQTMYYQRFACETCGVEVESLAHGRVFVPAL